MPSPEAILARIRAEYREMPGLRLTLPQACRFWQLEPAECEMVVETLLAEQFLMRAADGRFVALPTPHDAHSRQFKASLTSRAATEQQRRA